MMDLLEPPAERITEDDVAVIGRDETECGECGRRVFIGDTVADEHGILCTDCIERFDAEYEETRRATEREWRAMQ